MAVLFLSVLFCGYFAATALKEIQFNSVSESLRKQAEMVGVILGPRLSVGDKVFIDSFCDRLGSNTPYRLTVLAPDGSILGDSEGSPSKMENHTTRPEIREAMGGVMSSSTRYSFTVNKDLVYVALPIIQDGNVIGIVRASTSIERLSNILNFFYGKLAIAILLLVIVVAVLSLIVSRRISEPLAELKNAAQRYANGDFAKSVNAGGATEIQELAEAINSMVTELRARLTTMTRQRNELESLLSEMVEAVIVVDSSKRIMRMNQAAEEIFQTTLAQASGRQILESIRNGRLNEFVTRTLTSAVPIEDELTVIGTPDKILQTHGTLISDTHGTPIGAMIVLNDISRLKNIDQIRKDFVANVSHELKTPVTSIKGFLETLRDGAINDPGTASRFLDIAIKHTDKLTSIIEDLLKLSRVEQDADKGAMKLEKASVCEPVRSVVKFMETLAHEKNIQIITDCDPSLEIEINRQLFEQALSNLLDNAIKYSEKGSEVCVTAHKSNHEALIEVKDKGCGIPRDQLPRIFERFFRVDRARARDTGGAGLGLSIARHIINLHSGRIDVSSGIGQGSLFTIRIPLK
jgi:two-component system phosphate regulon sensor histidine kinase PhoR